MSEGLLAILTAAIFLLMWKSRRSYMGLPELPVAEARGPLDLTVIIPARNEAHQIGRAVRSFAGVPVMVVDDASADATAAAAQEAGARVIAAPALPPGAKGKPNACRAGANAATSKWILFVDADTWFEPAFAASLVGYAEREHLQVVSAFLDQQCVSVAERALLPYSFALYFAGVNATHVNSGTSAEALANGQCLLFERAAYEAIGGHGAVLSSVIEDVAMARVAKQHGLRLRVVRAEQLGHVRMYDSFRAIWRGFEKNSFRFLLVNPWSGVQVVATSIVLTSWLPALIVAGGDLPSGERWNALAGAWPLWILFLAPFVALRSWYKPWWDVALAPFAIYLFQLIALNGMLTAVTGRKTIWKERHV